ncbi:hypothetical protein D9M69_630530 [compost metagenome]
MLAAAFMTRRPDSAEPVKIRWSKGMLENAEPLMSGTIARVCSEKFSFTRRCSRAQRLRELAAILTMQRLPAARALVTGPMTRYSG